MRDVDRYPHVLSDDVWHRRPADDPSDGPVYYKTLRGATNAARKHATEGHPHRLPVEEVTR